MNRKNIVIGCEMLQDEILLAYKRTGCDWPIRWIPRKYHNTPEKLKEILQETINECQDYDRILLTFGNCGGAIEGLTSEQAELVLFDFEDCIHMLLYSRQEHVCKVQKGVIYLTNGWTKDEQSIVQQHRYTEKKYGKKMCSGIMQMMYGNFNELSVIETGAYELEDTIAYAKQAAEVTKLQQTCCKGNTISLEKLLLGDFSEKVMIYSPGTAVKKKDYT